MQLYTIFLGGQTEIALAMVVGTHIEVGVVVVVIPSYMFVAGLL